MSEKFQLTEQWGLRKLQLGDRCEWALQYLGMDWIRMSEFFPSKNAPNIMDDDIRKFAEAVRALSLQDHGWRPIPAPNDSAFRWYGLHVQHSGGYSWFEAHYVAHVDGQMLHPSGDNFDDWAFTDFEFWCDAPPIPAMVAEEQTEAKP